jgi:hypothetical protein
MANVVFIEGMCEKWGLLFDPNASCTIEDVVIISLTPEASYHLKKDELDYKIPEDYFVWDSREHKSDFDVWFGTFRTAVDSVAMEIFPMLEELPYPVSQACIVMLRGMLLPFFVRVQQFKAIMGVESPSKIWFIGRGGEDQLEPELRFLKGESLFRRLCSSSWHPGMEARFISAGEEELTSWRDNKRIRQIYNFFRTFQCFPLMLGNGGTVWFANVIPKCMRQSKLRGYRTKLVPQVETFDFNLIDINSDYQETNTLCLMVADKAGIPVEVVFSVLGTRFNYFLCSMVPQIYALAKGYMAFFSTVKQASKDIPFVVFNNVNSVQLIGMLYGTVLSETKTMFLDHGWDGYDLFETRYYEKMMPFTHYVSFTSETDDYYQKLREATR